MNHTSRSKHGVFISYARADGEAVAHALQTRLQTDAPDVSTWLDRYEIEGGVGWWNQIEEALDRAEFLLLVMTPAAMRSDNTRREWRSARQRGVCVYPVKGTSDGQLEYSSLPNWMRKAHFYDPELEWAKLIAHLRRGCVATRVPFMAPALPLGFVARSQQLTAVRELIADVEADERAGRTVALRGAGGFGKTTLAAAICHDEQVIDAFDDGILWVTLGQAPNLLNELVKLYAALTGERPGFVDVEDAARELALKLESLSCLLVIDDAWTAAHLGPFAGGGPGCARLITTRLHEVAAGTRRIEIEQMQPAEALQLLLARSGAQPQDLAPFRSLSERLGDWPLPIKLAGSTMRQRIERGDTVTNALDYVRRALDKRGITAFDKEYEAGRSDAVARTVAASLDLLEPEERRRYAELAIFPEDVAISLATAAKIWQLDDLDSEDLARKLDDLGLIEFDLRQDLLRMHDVLRDFLLKLLPDPAAVHARLVDAWGDPYHLPDADAWRGYAFHMVGAGRQAALQARLLDLRWLDARQRATDIASLIGDFEHTAGSAATELVRDALRLSAPAVTADPQQLRTQLLGRLMSRSEPEIVALCEQVIRSTSGAWLRVLHSSLDSPGGTLVLTLVGHTRGVTSLAVDIDYRTLVSASEDGTVRVWDPSDGRVVRMFEHRKLGVRAVATTGDGQLVLSGGADGKLYLWDTARGELVCDFFGVERKARTALALAADGAVAVCGSRDSDVRTFDLREFVERLSSKSAKANVAIQVLSGHAEQVTSVAVSANGRRAVSGSDDGTVRVWDVERGALERALHGHTAAVNAVALSADGRFALSGSSDRAVKLWDIEQGACVRTLTGHAGGITAVDLAAGGRRAISGSSDQSARLWNLDDGTALASLEGHSDSVTTVVINDAGTRAATGSADRTIKLWRLDELSPVDPSDAHTGGIASLLFSADGRLCASGGGEGLIKIRDVGSGRLLRTIDAHDAAVRSLAFTPDGSCLLSSGVDDRTWLWTVDDGQGAWISVRHWAPVNDCALSGTARYMATACSDQYVYLWEVRSGALLERYGTRRLFDHLIEPSKRRKELPDDLLNHYLPGERIYDVVAIQMSDDGSRAVFSATARDSGTIRTPPSQHGDTHDDGAFLLVFDTATGEIHTVQTSQLAPVTAFAIDARTNRLLWAAADHHLELWDLDANERVATMRGHAEKVNAVAFGNDGQYAISCARDRSLIAWNLSTGERVAAFTADAALKTLAVASDGTFAVGDVAGHVHFLRLMGA